MERRIVLTAPVAAADSYVVSGSSLSVPAAGLLANDFDADGDPLSAVVASQPANGSLTLQSDGSFLYTPHPGFAGFDTFTYRAITPNPTQTFQIVQSQSNLQVEATLSVPVFGNRTSIDSSSLIGDISLRVTPAQTPFSEILISDLDVYLADGIALTFNYGIFVGRVSADAPPYPNPNAFHLTMNTPGAPAPVVGGAFNQTGNDFAFSGVADVQATGIFNGLVPSGPTDLSLDNVSLDLAGTVSQAGSTVTVSFPVSFSDTLDLDGATIDFNLTGTVVASGPVAAAEASAETQVTLVVESSGPAEIGRHLYYRNSAFDSVAPSDALAESIEPLFPGEDSSGANISNYVRGINGMIVDLPALALPAQISSADFVFRAGTGSEPASWPLSAAPSSVTYLPGAGPGGSHRIAIAWPDGAIADTWLETTILAGPRTALVAHDTFYFGNLRGDSTTDGSVNANDFNAVRTNPATFLQPAPLDSGYDLNRDARVDAADLLIVRDHASLLGGGLPTLFLSGSLFGNKAFLPAIIYQSLSGPTTPRETIALQPAAGSTTSHADEAALALTDYRTRPWQWVADEDEDDADALDPTARSSNWEPLDEVLSDLATLR